MHSKEFLITILIRCKFVHFNQKYSEIFTDFAENLPLLKGRSGSKTFGLKNRVILIARRVIARRVIARYTTVLVAILALNFFFLLSHRTQNSKVTISMTAIKTNENAISLLLHIG